MTSLALYVINQSTSRPRLLKFNTQAAIALLTFTAIIFCTEVLLLLIHTMLQSLYLHYISLKYLLLVRLISGLGSLGTYHVNFVILFD